MNLTAFQSNAFQFPGFQIEVNAPIIRETTFGGGGGFGSYSSIYFDNLPKQVSCGNEKEIEEFLLLLFNLGEI